MDEQALEPSTPIATEVDLHHPGNVIRFRDGSHYLVGHGGEYRRVTGAENPQLVGRFTKAERKAQKRARMNARNA